jgi:hypothetical protein
MHRALAETCAHSRAHAPCFVHAGWTRTLLQQQPTTRRSVAVQRHPPHGMTRLTGSFLQVRGSLSLNGFTARV